MTTDVIYWIVGAYFIGSIPFGLLLGFLTGKGDIRKVGSGNIGATNMMRAGGKKLAALTLILDGMKGFVPVFLYVNIRAINIYHLGFNLCKVPTPSCTSSFFAAWNQETQMTMTIIFTAAILGHIFPIWLKFKGGKGVATFWGGLFGLHWMAGIVFIALWLGMFKLKRISALSALTALYLAPFYVFYFTHSTTTMNAVALMAALIIYRHKDNIKRMMSGAELGFSTHSKNKDTPA